jgi:hypothetical protein
MAFATKGAPPNKTAQKAPVSAARAPVAPTPALRTQPAQDIALPADLMAELAGAAKDAAAKERPAVGRISLKSGVMSYQGNAMPDNAMEVVIVGGSYRNVWYAGRYDSDNIVNPSCFALAAAEEDLVAHENVPDDNVPGDSDVASRDPDGSPRACKGCAMGEWGSSPTGGRGKACKQTRRLILLPADALESGEPDDVLKAEMAILDVPVTSVKNYANLVSTLAATLNLPVWAVRTYVKVVPNAKTQFQVEFTPLAPAGDAVQIRALMKRRDEAMRMALVPYDGVGGENDPDAGAAPAPAAPLKNKFAAKRK